MIPIFYRSYPYAPKATMISALSYVGMFLTAVGGIVCFALFRENWLLIPLGISWVMLKMPGLRKLVT